MIELRHVTKRFGSLTALDSLSLKLERGDVFGFIGPNGAGKTTTIKMLATLLAPTGGTAYVDGIDVVREPEAVRAVIGYMPDTFGVYDDFRVWEYLDFFAAAYRIPPARRPRAVDEVLELTDLRVKKQSYVESLSRGMKQRLCLARTLIHDPKVLLLDEPASGLDPRARIEFKELMRELRAMGKTIIVSSHILPELADFCNKIGVIEKGELLVAGDVGEIMRQVAGQHTLEVRVAPEDPVEVPTLAVRADGASAVARAAPAAAVEQAVATLRMIEEIGEVRATDGVIRAIYTGPRGGEWRVLHDLVARGVRVLAFGTEPTDLEDVFMRTTRNIVA